MKNTRLTFLSFAAVGFIYVCTAVAWFILSGALAIRSDEASYNLCGEVESGWGGSLSQNHPTAWYRSPTGKGGRGVLLPSSSQVEVDLDYEPVRKGLLWYRTYTTRFAASYQIANPTPIEQTVYVSFELPSESASYNAFTFTLGEMNEEKPVPQNGFITQAVVIPAGGSVPLKVGYHVRGADQWRYDLGGSSRVQNFQLKMKTNFEEVNFASASPNTREVKDEGGMVMSWDYPDVIGAKSITMDMPKVLNAGPVASRISFFAPVSLLFFFAVLLILGGVSGISLHPMNYFFLSAGCFAFQLLFAYLVDLLPLLLSFIISASVSMTLVCGYLHAVAGWKLTRIAVPAQFAYMVLFSYSFFFDGLSGLTIAIGGILTLAILMIATAKTDWSSMFVRKQSRRVSTPPPIPSTDI